MKIICTLCLIVFQLLIFSQNAYSKNVSSEGVSSEAPGRVADEAKDIEMVLSYTEGQVARLANMKEGLAQVSADQPADTKVTLCKALEATINPKIIEQLKRTAIYLADHRNEMSESQKSRFDFLKPKTDALSIQSPLCS